MKLDNYECDGQMSIFEFMKEPKEEPQKNYELPCDTCGHDIQDCCDYDNINDYCVMGNKWVPKKNETDDYIKENPTCFYVFGHYLDREEGWHKVPEELPTFTTWSLIDVVIFGQKSGTVWMEHGEWEAKDWTFRSMEDKRKTETLEILAWKLSD